MSTPQHITLLALAAGPLAISDLGAATGVAVSTATRMVQALEREGWVGRVAEPGGDRRRRPVALTAAGRAVMISDIKFPTIRASARIREIAPGATRSGGSAWSSFWRWRYCVRCSYGVPPTALRRSCAAAMP